MATFQLNEQQLEAIRYISGPCLVIAGAGSGKTRVITEKIVHLIKNCSYDASNICAVTFTNKAAKEMKERISQELSQKDLIGLRVSTFHALCLEILREEYVFAKLNKQFTILDNHDQVSIMKDILLELDPSLTSDLLSEESVSALSAISKFKNDLVSPDDVYDLEIKNKEYLYKIYSKYNKLLELSTAIDFDDIILKATTLFKNNDQILKKWRNRIKYLLVDEYQDTNQAQYEFVKCLVKEHEHFTFVGDDDQSIYSWRGARVENINILSVDFPSLKVIMLEQNYRSRGRILKCANKLIENNEHKFLKKLYSQHEVGDFIRVLIGKNPSDEASKVVVDLMASKLEKRAKYEDFAILYRSNYQSREIEEQLLRARIPYKLIGGTSFFGQPEIRDMMNYLRVLAYDDDLSAFLQIINLPPRGIGPKTLEAFTDYANKNGLSYLPATLDNRIFTSLSINDSKKFSEFGTIIKTIRTSLEGDNALDYIDTIPDVVGYNIWLKDHIASEKAVAKIQNNISILLGWLKRTMQGDSKIGDPQRTFNEAMDKLSLREMLDRDEQDYELDQVTLMTLHSSKGLEFKYVYLIGMEEGILPHNKSIEENNDQVDEERRLAYVGITRAKVQLTLSYSKTRSVRDPSTHKIVNQNTKPSRFLEELPQEDLAIDGVKNEAKELQDAKDKESIIQSLDALFKSM